MHDATLADRVALVRPVDGAREVPVQVRGDLGIAAVGGLVEELALERDLRLHAADVRMEDLAVVADQRDHRVVAAEQALAAVDDLHEHRLRVGHRAADDLQDLRGRDLLVVRLVQFVGQTCVLDRERLGAVARPLRRRHGAAIDGLHRATRSVACISASTSASTRTGFTT